MPNGDFEPMYSTNNIWYDTYTTQNLTVHLEDIAADIDTLQTSKANINHTHTGYALSNHSHAEYALTNHTHNGYSLSTHSHSYNDLTDKPDIPTTLPANGGNSDTVDGKHASDFATAESVDMLQTLVGDTSVQSQISMAVNSITPANIGAAEEDHTHNYNDLTHKPAALPANGGDADTVDGKHASEFATSTSVDALENLVGNTSVQSQISSAIESHTHSYNDLTDKPAMPDMSALTYSANSAFTFSSLNGYLTENNIYRRGNIVIYKATIVLGYEFQGGSITLTIPNGFAPTYGSYNPIVFNTYTWDLMKLDKPMPCPCSYSYDSEDGGRLTMDVTYGGYDYSHEQVRLCISGIGFMS